MTYLLEHGILSHAYEVPSNHRKYLVVSRSRSISIYFLPCKEDPLYQVPIQVLHSTIMVHDSHDMHVPITNQLQSLEFNCGSSPALLDML